MMGSEAPTDGPPTVETIREAGAGRRSFSSDFGQAYAPVPVERYRMFLAAFLRCDLTDRESRVMTHDHQATLRGL
jgi:hypothetical protein